MRRFNDDELQLVQGATREAQSLVSAYYAIAPREWMRMRYEVRTQCQVEPAELLDSVLAHLVCYEHIRQLGGEILYRGDIYRICLQDNRILTTTETAELKLSELLIYVLTHELVHVVRFAQQLQRLDLPMEQRWHEEQSVEMITERILRVSPDQRLRQLIGCRQMAKFA